MKKESPLISAVTAKMEAMIGEGTFPVGSVLPSERDLSKQFATSRQVIRAAARELFERGFISVKPRCRPVVLPLKAARRNGATGKRHIGIWLWPNMGDFAAASILKGIQSSDIGPEVRLIVANAVGNDWETIFDSEAKFLQSIAEDPEAAGLIAWYLGADRNFPAIQSLKDQGVPIVFVDRLPPEGISADFVGTDNETAVRRGVQHLIEMGHRRIAHLTNMENVSTVRERETGYRKALREAGIPVREDYIYRDRVDGPEGVEPALDAWLRMAEPPTAIFCVNDHIALQVYEALQDRKISVPQQMSVVGFDGLLRWVPGGGYLTTLLQDFERMGQLAAEIVIRRMTNGTPDAFKHVLLDAPLSDRGSSGPPQPKDLLTQSHFPSKEKSHNEIN